MICERCNQKEATVHMAQMVNGDYKEIHVCADCAQSLGADMSTFTMSDMFQSLSGLRTDRGQSCPSCHLSYSEFKRTGMLGCADCYKAFSKELLPMISALHGSTAHVGKSSPQAAEGSGEEAAPVDERQKLKEELQLAIKEERYEYAAQLRDKLKELEADGNGTV